MPEGTRRERIPERLSGRVHRSGGNGETNLVKGLHANTHIPQVIGAARTYELTGDQPYYEAAMYSWNQIELIHFAM